MLTVMELKTDGTNVLMMQKISITILDWDGCPDTPGTTAGDMYLMLIMMELQMM